MTLRLDYDFPKPDGFAVLGFTSRFGIHEPYWDSRDLIRISTEEYLNYKQVMLIDFFGFICVLAAYISPRNTAYFHLHLKILFEAKY